MDAPFINPYAMHPKASSAILWLVVHFLWIGGLLSCREVWVSLCRNCHVPVLFAALVATVYAAHRSILLSNPGYLRTDDTLFQDLVSALDTAHIDQPPNSHRPTSLQSMLAPHNISRFCRHCNQHVPLRSKHCKVCGLCVATFDHHCPLLGSCIGERNRLHYVYLLAVQLLLIVFIDVLGLWSVLPKPSAVLWKDFIADHMGFYLTLLTSSFAVAYLAILFFGQLLFLATNQTMYDYIKGSASAYLVLGKYSDLRKFTGKTSSCEDSIRSRLDSEQLMAHIDSVLRSSPHMHWNSTRYVAPIERLQSTARCVGKCTLAAIECVNPLSYFTIMQSGWSLDFLPMCERLPEDFVLWYSASGLTQDDCSGGSAESACSPHGRLCNNETYSCCT